MSKLPLDSSSIGWDTKYIKIVTNNYELFQGLWVCVIYIHLYSKNGLYLNLTAYLFDDHFLQTTIILLGNA